jgi:hypothetical protein
MAGTIAPKSSQLNADDLLSGPRTVRVTKVFASDSAEQPIAVAFDGDDDRPYFPCKSMRRVMVAIWGPDAAQYVGRSMTLYRDPDVTWGGMAVGGIRISAMSDMTEPVVLALTATKKARKPFRVEPLNVEPPPVDRAIQMAAALVARFDAVPDAAALSALDADDKASTQRAWLKDKRPELSQDVEAAVLGAQKRTEAPA